MTETKPKPKWDEFAEKGKRDAALREKLDVLVEKYRAIFFSRRILKKEYQETLLPQIEKEIEGIFQEISQSLSEKEKSYHREQILKTMDQLHFYSEHEAYAKVEFSTFEIYSIITNLSSIIDEVEIHLKKEGIEIRFMDPSRIMLTKLSITAETYECFREGKAGVILSDLADILKCNVSDKSTATILFTEHNLLITAYSEKYRVPIEDQYRLVEIDIEEIPMDNLIEIQYPFRFLITRERFEFILRQLNIHSEIINIKATLNNVKFYNSGQIGARQIVLDKTNLSDFSYTDIEEDEEEEQENSEDPTASAGYSYKFVKSVAKLISLLNPSSAATFYLKEMTPLKIHFKLPLCDIHDKSIGTLEAYSFIAPRPLEDDESEEDEEIEDF